MTKGTSLYLKMRNTTKCEVINKTKYQFITNELRYIYSHEVFRLLLLLLLLLLRHKHSAQTKKNKKENANSQFCQAQRKIEIRAHTSLSFLSGLFTKMSLVVKGQTHFNNTLTERTSYYSSTRCTIGHAI